MSIVSEPSAIPPRGMVKVWAAVTTGSASGYNTFKGRKSLTSGGKQGDSTHQRGLDRRHQTDREYMGRVAYVHTHGDQSFW